MGSRERAEVARPRLTLFVSFDQPGKRSLVRQRHSIPTNQDADSISMTLKLGHLRFRSVLYIGDPAINQADSLPGGG